MDTSSRANIAFIGGGNMARAIAGGLLRSGFEPGHVLLSEPLAERRTELAQLFPACRISSDNRHIAAHAGTLVLAVKPQILRGVCEDLADVVQDQKPLVISIAAGPRIEDIDG